MPKYIFLQYIDESAAPRPGTPELDAVIEAFATYLEELKAAGAFIDGDPCQPSSAAFTAQVRDGEATTTDGPMSSAVPWLTATSCWTARIALARWRGRRRIRRRTSAASRCTRF
jgi:hypothetical protein